MGNILFIWKFYSTNYYFIALEGQRLKEFSKLKVFKCKKKIVKKQAHLLEIVFFVVDIFEQANI